MVRAVEVFVRSLKLFEASKAPESDVRTAVPFCVIVPETFRVPPMRVLPLAAILNLDEELIWKLMKSPLNGDAKLEAISVPETLPF